MGKSGAGTFGASPLTAAKKGLARPACLSLFFDPLNPIAKPHAAMPAGS